MKVYFSGSLWGHKKYERPMKRIVVDKKFRWEELEVFLPAIYVGRKGVVMDFCVQIPLEKINTFLQKWNLLESAEQYTEEEERQIERENPMSVHFNAEVMIDGHRLKGRNSCGASWIPIPSLAETNSDVKEAIAAYGYSLEEGWYIVRAVYQWNGKPILQPKILSIRLHADKVTYVGEHFITRQDCKGQQISLRHPITGEVFELTINGCCRERFSDSRILQQYEKVPEWYYVLDYEISPQPKEGEILLLDCACSDRTQLKHEGEKAASAISIIGGADGPTAIFFAGRTAKKRVCSALHYEPAAQVEWRAEFLVSARPDMELEFEIRKEMKESI